MRSDSRFRGGRKDKRRRGRPLVGLHNEVRPMLDSPSLPSASRACLSLPEAEDDDQSVRPAPYPPCPVQTAGQQRRAAAPDNSPTLAPLPWPIWSSARIPRASVHDCCRARLLRGPYPTKTSLAEIALSGLATHSLVFRLPLQRRSLRESLLYAMDRLRAHAILMSGPDGVARGGPRCRRQRRSAGGISCNCLIVQSAACCQI